MRAGAAVVLDVSRHENSDRIQGAVRAVPNELSGWLKEIKGHETVVGLYCS
jgi:hypothetical protein